MSRGIVWFRRDLRLGDNPAWSAATNAHGEVTALFVIDPGLWDVVTEPRRVLLARHLEAVDQALATRGGRLRVEQGDPAEIVPRVMEQLDADMLHANRDVSPFSLRRDQAVADRLEGRVTGHDGIYLVRPGTVLAGSGEPYKVFTPFHKRWLEMLPGPVPPDGSAAVDDAPGSGIPPIKGTPIHAAGEDAARHRLMSYLDAHVDRYEEVRNRPDLDETSRLSIDLKFGTLGPHTVVDAAGFETPGRRAFIRQIAWRDFHAQTMVMKPDLTDAPYRPEYAGMAWKDDPDGYEAWCRGQTGYPLVDAGMRQLLAEGWMHNRVRMITASMLIKDLLIDWRKGERWFRRHLLDADPAQNAGNWQWVAGTGTDAAPYFRIFNPVSQSRKFDPSGDYIRRYIPELAQLDDRAIHAPWDAAPLDLAAAGVTLGDTYPAPIVDHAEARQRALDAYRAARGE